MKKLLLMLVFVFFLAGCNSNLTFSEIEIKNVKRDILTFFKSVEDENGIHLYMDGKEVIYVMLNGKNVMEGEQAIHFTGFSVDADDESLLIYYNEEETDDYSDQTLKHQVVYKVNKDRDYEKLRTFRNGEEVPIGVVSGTN